MFTKRIKIFELLGFPIYIDLSWFIIVLLITWSLASSAFPRYYEGLSQSTYWMMGLAGAFGLFASILLHELGHSVVARRFQVPMRGITLFIFGGVAEMTEEPPSAKAEFFVAIAGPIVSVIIAIACYAAEPVDHFMNSAPVTVPPTATIHELVDDYVYKYHHKMFPVTGNGRLDGCITTNDIQQVPREQWDQRTVGDVVKPCDDENTIERGSDSMQALSQMQRKGASRLMVVHNGHLEGILSLKDMLKFIALKVELEDDGNHSHRLPLKDSA